VTRRLAILAHEEFPDRAKTATGVMRYGDDEVVAVLDRTKAGTRVRDHRPDLPDAPVVASFEDAPPCDALLIGISPIGGGFEESWRPDVGAALERGCDVLAGLHYFLADDAEFAALAAQNGADLVDLRRPPADLTVAEGVARDVDADVVLTVGTDCSVGKMTTTLELVRAAERRGLEAAFVPTGQTGIAVAGWGIAVDRVVSDFVAGAVERMVLDAAGVRDGGPGSGTGPGPGPGPDAAGPSPDVVFVEGQGALSHPAYSAVTCGILHGAMPDRLVLCHAAGREAVHGYESFPLPSPGDAAACYERTAAPVHPTEVVAGSLNTASVDGDAAAREACAGFGDALGAPATDPVRFDPDALLGAVL
jgi:uncharacterized NAD-dependent epimerase/dehydratase family protein